MVAQSNTQIALEFIEGFNNHDFSRWSNLLSDDFSAQYPGAPLLNREHAVL